MKILKLIVLTILFTQCSSHKTITTITPYNEFRTSQKTFTHSDGKIRYIDKGEGEVFLLLHGVPSSSWLYRKIIPELVAQGHRVIAPDMLGYGNSDNPKGYEIYSQQNHAKRILALMEHLQIKSWNHVMHDAGGLWTWELIDQQPEKLNHSGLKVQRFDLTWD